MRLATLLFFNVVVPFGGLFLFLFLLSKFLPAKREIPAPLLVVLYLIFAGGLIWFSLIFGPQGGGDCRDMPGPISLC